jgi:hypothetical protein
MNTEHEQPPMEHEPNETRACSTGINKHEAKPNENNTSDAVACVDVDGDVHTVHAVDAVDSVDVDGDDDTSNTVPLTSRVRVKKWNAVAFWSYGKTNTNIENKHTKQTKQQSKQATKQQSNKSTKRTEPTHTERAQQTERTQRTQPADQHHI